ncbi:MAG: T9SS type A sorting domain-containing protein [Bacteroidetes bacterium]|nr:T9SS type A sorting domain-containing protein [Bacteroidota bacterium]
MEPARIVEIGPQGELANEAAVELPGMLIPSLLLVPGTASGLVLLGTQSPYPVTAADSTRMVVFNYDTDLTQHMARALGKPGKGIGSYAGCIGSDNTMRITYSTEDWAGNLHQFETLKATMDGDSITGHRIMESMVFAIVGSLAALPDGGIIMGSSNANMGAPMTSTGYISYLNNNMEADTTYALSYVAPGSTDTWNTPMAPLQTLPLPGGNLLVSGAYWPSFGNDRGAVVQRTGPQGHKLNQFIANTHWPVEVPALVKAMSFANDGSLYYGQTANWISYATNGSEEPSMVQVFRLDTGLNQIGSYTFNGYSDSAFYAVAFVTAEPDGGVVVGGMKRDLRLPDQPVMGWVVKLGAATFTTGIGEQAHSPFSLYPNPGSTGFRLHLQQGVPGGSLLLHDAQGRQVLKQPLGGTEASVHVPGLAPGLYLATVVNSQGVPLHTMRWSKVE